MGSLIRQAGRGAAVLMLLVAAACSSTPEADVAVTPGAAAGLTINIQNDHQAASTFTLFIEPAAGGVRESLGTIQAGTSRVITYDAPAGSRYVLIQQTASGDSRSSQFTVQGATVVNWDMNGRRLTVTRR